MANWYGTARSNYVRVADLEGLKKALEPWDLEMEEGEGGKKSLYVFFGGEGGNGGFPTFGVTDEDQDIEFDWAVHVVPFLVPGETLVVMESGAEKKRYVTGWAGAYHWDGKRARVVTLSIENIYEMASRRFKVPVADISKAQY